MIKLDGIFELDITAKTKSFKKKEIIQRKGATNSRSYYIKKGLLRAYIIDDNGKEHTYMFAPEEWILSDLEALESNDPVELYIDCLEDSEIVVFDKESLFNAKLGQEKLVENTKLLWRRIGKLQRRVIMLMSSPAIDRYNYFLKTYPELPNRVPQHMIATYLGITPQALSTIKGKVVRTKD
ncbi:Crp/Fnr family transcriptional regulator [Crocinitomicaceae bacterium]|nr:Crp/Fnr family transcriptional regulator [Crocinitomicaceae bacterium]